ncbi:MAG TPA: hypothetical protein VFZ53_22115 [Polyangiaceae bacterium]
MRWLGLPSCAVLVLLGCGSEPLEGVADEPATVPVTPGDAPSGEFRPIAAYPPGPYGSTRGAVIADHTFLGWRDPVRSAYDENRLEEVRLSDFHDPRGGRTELIVINASAVWCPACRTEMATIDAQGLAEAYGRAGVALLGTLFEDARGRPATPRDLALWGNELSFRVAFPLVLDPALKLGPYFAQSVTPLNLVVDANTMEILAVFMGYSESLWWFVDDELERRGIAPPVR